LEPNSRAKEQLIRLRRWLLAFVVVDVEGLSFKLLAGESRVFLAGVSLAAREGE